MSICKLKGVAQLSKDRVTLPNHRFLKFGCLNKIDKKQGDRRILSNIPCQSAIKGCVRINPNIG